MAVAYPHEQAMTPETRAIIYNDGRWWLAIFDGNKAVIKMELRSENGWSLLRSLVEMLAA